MPAPTPHRIQRYGWIPDLPDARDHVYAAPRAFMGRRLPTQVDLAHTAHLSMIRANWAVAPQMRSAPPFSSSYEADITPDFVPSRLFIYYNERVIEKRSGLNR